MRCPPILSFALLGAFLCVAPARAQYAYNPYEGETKESARSRSSSSSEYNVSYSYDPATEGRRKSFRKRSRSSYGSASVPASSGYSASVSAPGMSAMSSSGASSAPAAGSGAPRGNIFGGMATAAAIGLQTGTQVAKFIEQIREAKRQYEKIKRQYKMSREALRQLGDLEIRSIDDFMGATDQVLGAGEALAYNASMSVSDLQGMIDEHYPVGDPNALITEQNTDRVGEKLTQVENTFQMLRQHASQIDDAQAQMSRVQEQLVNAENPAQVAEAAATIEQFQLQNGQLQRRLTMNMVAANQRKEAEFAKADQRHRALKQEDFGLDFEAPSRPDAGRYEPPARTPSPSPTPRPSPRPTPEPVNPIDRPIILPPGLRPPVAPPGHERPPGHSPPGSTVPITYPGGPKPMPINPPDRRR